MVLKESLERIGNWWGEIILILCINHLFLLCCLWGTLQIPLFSSFVLRLFERILYGSSFWPLSIIYVWSLFVLFHQSPTMFFFSIDNLPIYYQFILCFLYYYLIGVPVEFAYKKGSIY